MGTDKCKLLWDFIISIKWLKQGDQTVCVNKRKRHCLIIMWQYQENKTLPSMIKRREINTRICGLKYRNC